MKLIHASDLHLVEPGKKKYGVDVQARLRAFIDSINRLHPDAELVVFSGDMAHDVGEETYHLLVEKLDRLKVPWRILAGNHDNREAMRRAIPELQTDRNGYLQGVQATSAGVCIFLDTLYQGGPGGLGRLCPERLRWLGNRLEELADQPVFLFLHHHPMKVGFNMDKMGLAKPERLVKTLKGYTNIRHLFCGHLHRIVSGSWTGIPFSSAGSLTVQVGLEFDMDKPIGIVHEPPSYAIALIEADSVVVHHHQYLEEADKVSLG